MGALGVMAWSMYWLWVQSTDDHGRSGGEIGFQSNGRNETTRYFPWEPVVPQRADIDPTGRHERRRKNDQSVQLDFLSSMTFANGGIRAPNCVCCL
jgi:hypothetical protein